jgi:hypothetical protein
MSFCKNAIKTEFYVFSTYFGIFNQHIYFTRNIKFLTLVKKSKEYFVDLYSKNMKRIKMRDFFIMIFFLPVTDDEHENDVDGDLGELNFSASGGAE